MDRYQASVLNRITDKGSPGWTIFALVIMYRWSIVGGLGGTGTLIVGAKALGWL
jgi:hypothetical protein